jgi:pullulanase/glycogen debranching enzyme
VTPACWPCGRQSRAILTTLLLSFGIAMLLGGGEMGRIQQGNNNAYCHCHDNEVTWFDRSTADTGLLAFTKRLVALRKAHPVSRRQRFLAAAATAIPDHGRHSFRMAQRNGAGGGDLAILVSSRAGGRIHGSQPRVGSARNAISLARWRWAI